MFGLGEVIWFKLTASYFPLRHYNTPSSGDMFT